MENVHWIKSSYSGANGDCVELALELGRIRDSKNPNGPALSVDVAGFVQAVKNGRFRR